MSNVCVGVEGVDKGEVDGHTFKDLHGRLIYNITHLTKYTPPPHSSHTHTLPPTHHGHEGSHETPDKMICDTC